MSSISFPTHSSSSSGNQEGFFGSPYHVSSSFQINPLSAHPPRTPRTSVASQSQVYGTDVYHPAEEIEEKQVLIEEEIGHGSEEVRDDAKANVRLAEVWREVLKSTAGRDKAFKIMQYGLRVYLLFHHTVRASWLLRQPAKLPWETELVKRLESTTSGLSLTRKCLILFNWLTPLTSILATQPMNFSSTRHKEPPKPLLHTFLHAPPPVLLDLVNGLSDDVHAFSRLGLVGKRTGERAGKFSDWCWFAGTLIALVELNFERNITKSEIHTFESQLYAESLSGGTAKPTGSTNEVAERELQRLRKQDYWLRIQRIKLLMDLIFVSYNVFQVRRARDTVKSFAGLISAILSSAKLYQNHQNTLIIKELQR